jgi:HK97 family phage portal protein
MFEFIKRLFVKESRTQATILEAYKYVRQPNFQAMISEGYKQVPYVYAAINLIARAVANLRYVTKKNETVLETENEFWNLFSNPNPFQGQTSFLKEIVTCLLTTGNAFIEIILAGNKPKELYNLAPDRMRIIPGNQKGIVKRYEYTVNGYTLELPAEEVIHIKLYNPNDDFFGLSPLHVLAYTIDQYIEMKKWQNGLLANGMRPSGAFVSEAPLSQTQYERLKEEAKNYQGAANTGKPLILEGGLKWQQISYNPDQFDWSSAQKILLREIAVVLGVAPELIGEPEFKTYSNFQEANRQLYSNTVIPLAEMIIEEFNRELSRYFSNILIAIDYDSIDALQEEQSHTWDRAVKGVQAGILTPNEARELLGYKPIKGGNYTMVSANLIPMGLGIDESEE